MTPAWALPAPPPPASGAYRWLYADAHAAPYTVVCIFMIGAVFSPRYAAAQRRGARPDQHCAVNCALYRDGRRVAWAFTERAGATRTRDVLTIGRSSFAYAPDGTVRITIAERTAPWGRPLTLELALAPAAPPAPEVRVDGAQPHFWQACIPRAAATLVVDGAPRAGLGYHDTNHGTERLGAGLPGWRWTRVHGADATWVRYRPPAPAPVLEMTARPDGTTLRTGDAVAEPLRRSGWGLRLPRRLAAGPADLVPTATLESAPFYARLEARRDGTHALGEVADFRRFHSPLLRWMAHVRMRVE